jgi:hypothetical protein
MQQFEFAGPNITVSLIYLWDTHNIVKETRLLDAVKAIQCT